MLKKELIMINNILTVNIINVYESAIAIIVEKIFVRNY